MSVSVKKWEKWFWVRQMGAGLLGGRNCNKGGQGIQAFTGRTRSEWRLTVAGMFVQCMSEKRPPGRKDSFTGQGMGGRRMTGIFSENFKEAFAAGRKRTGQTWVGVVEGGRLSRTLWAMCDDLVFHCVYNWELLWWFEHRDDIINLLHGEWSLSELRTKQRDSLGASARKQGKIMWLEPKEC